MSNIQSIRIVMELTIGKGFGCYGCMFGISDSGDVSLEVNQRHFSGFHRSVIVVRNVQTLKLADYRYFWVQSYLVAQGVDEQAILDCRYPESCNEFRAEMTDVSGSTSILCQYDGCNNARFMIINADDNDDNNDNIEGGNVTFSGTGGSVFLNCTDAESCVNAQFNVSGVTSITVDCLNNGCEYSTFDLRASIEDDTHMHVNCNHGRCGTAKWIVDNFDSVLFECNGEQSCDFGSNGDPFAQHFNEVTHLSVNCRSQLACQNFGSLHRPFSPALFQSVSIECDTIYSCFWDDNSTMDISNDAFDLLIEMKEAGSFGMRLPTMNETEQQQQNSNQEDSSSMKEMTLLCSGFESCHAEDGFEEMQRLSDFIANVGSYPVSLFIECTGRKSCLNNDFTVIGKESASLSVVCTGDESCDSTRINGHCAESVSLDIESETKDMTIICPFDSSARTCQVSVSKKNGAQLYRSRIGMSESDWRNEKYEIRGHREAYGQVTSVHVSAGKSDCKNAGFGDQAECFLVFSDTNREWKESDSCSNFVMSLYSPFTVLIGSLTVWFGVLFLFAAMNQTRKKKAKIKPTHDIEHCNSLTAVMDLHSSKEEEDDIDEDEDVGFLLSGVLWPRNLMTVTLGMLSMTAVVCSIMLLSHQSKSQTEISNGNFPRLPSLFYFSASFNAACFLAFVSAVETWLVFSDKHEWNDFLGWIRNKVDPSRECTGRNVWISVSVMITSLRTIQMLVYYIFYSANWIAAFGICLTMDLCLIIPSQIGLVCLMCLMTWMFISQYSPIPLPSSEPTFFQVITQNSPDQSSQIWFDVLTFELIFSVGSMVVTGRHFRETTKIWGMFVQFFDLATDLTVVGFWMVSGLWLWAIVESLFVVCTAMIQWCFLKEYLVHWKEHLMILTSMGRGYTKIRLWNDRVQRWVIIDKACALLETFYESLPSMVFGIYLFLSNAWESQLRSDDDGNNNDTVSTELGPLLISMFITALSVATKVIQYTMSLKVKLYLKASLFFFTLTDFVVRSVPLSVCLALMQGDTSNTTVSVGLLIGFPLLMSSMIMIQSMLIKYSCVSPLEWRMNALVRSIPSVVSCAPLLFASLRIRGITRAFDLHRFLRVHVVSVVISLIMLLISISIKPSSIEAFSGVMVAYLVCLCINLGCTRLVWFIKLNPNDDDDEIPLFWSCYFDTDESKNNDNNNNDQKIPVDSVSSL